MPGVLHRPVWSGTPVKGGDIFTLRKVKAGAPHVAVCELWTHVFGWELRLLVDDDLQRSQVCRSFNEWLDASDEWKGGDAREGLGMSSDEHSEPILRLWVSSHGNGWEAWVAQHRDGTFTAWACPFGANAAAHYVEDTFENATSAAMFALRQLSQHDQCGPACSAWSEREPPGHSHE